jgi:hypothetical protein
VYDDTIYNFCARARFAGCTYLRHIILGLNTVYSPAPPSLLPTLPTNPLHLIPFVTWLGYLEGPVLWLALYLLIISPCLTLSPPYQNKKDNLIPIFICMTIIKLFNHIYLSISQ